MTRTYDITDHWIVPTGPPHFEDDNHALLCGMVLGYLNQHGIDAQPTVDPLGNYTSDITIVLPTTIDGYTLAGKPITLTVNPYRGKRDST